MSSRASIWALACLGLALTGCATAPKMSAPASGTAIPKDLAELETWQARGRLGVSGPNNGGSGSFDWKQTGDHAVVDIRGPIGIGGVHLEMRGEGANPALKLQTSDGRTVESDAAWSELQTRLGVDVPAGNLRFWILGVAAPGEHRWSEADANGNVSLDQDGWHIQYQNYSEAPGARVPMKMTATSGDARVRIVVERWQLGQ